MGDSYTIYILQDAVGSYIMWAILTIWLLASRRIGPAKADRIPEN